MTEFKKLSSEDAAGRGILYSTKVREDTGELRARLTVPGADVTITQVPRSGGGWQKSHRHERVVEVSFVVRGMVVQVEQSADGQMSFTLFSEGTVFQTSPGLAHNTYVYPDTMMVTTKLHDSPETRDWTAHPELDEALIDLTGPEIYERAIK